MKYSILLMLTILINFFSQAQIKTASGTGKPLVLGEVHEMRSVVLSEKRILNIYLPEGYNKNDTITYPVVYLLDGGMNEDFIDVAGLYQFNSFSWINQVKPSIIVGIVNTDRKRDMTFPTTDTADKRRYPTAGHSDRFISFLEKELKPFVQKQFKINNASTLIGESLGGLLAAEILLKRPDLFTKYIIVSPSLWWDNGSLLQYSTNALESISLPEITVYIGVGKEGQTPNDVPRIMEADANYLAEQIRHVKNKMITLYFDYLPQENHATIMHQAVFNALRTMKK
ncbi:MAG TPA: alpha/beta hydrolase-fold protein [Flavisolibacter sp.]|nr:alpha/beta hydrolase-fold protein [Flavisolibacter sp.]